MMQVQERRLRSARAGKPEHRINGRARGEEMIRIEGLSKRYGRLTALDGLDLSIRRGEVTAVLGPNGAGKSTLIKSILGLVRPEAGRITVGGMVVNGAPEYRRMIGYMPQSARYPENLTGREIIRMIRDLREDDGEVDLRLVDALRLEPELDKPFRALSGGNRQKISAVIAFLFRPDILFLDEPSTGLDPVSSSTLKDRILAERQAGRTIVLSSHIMSEVQELGDRVVYLLDGRIHFEASVNELLERTGEESLERAIASLVSGSLAGFDNPQ
jgi:Cu-processing system ATP-binding protein